MPKFIELTLVSDLQLVGERIDRTVLINTEKIDYIREVTGDESYKAIVAVRGEYFRVKQTFREIQIKL